MPDDDKTPNGGEAVFDVNTIPEAATTVVKINDKDVTVKARDLPKLAAMGYHVSKRLEEVAQKERDLEARAIAKEQELARTYEPQTRLMQYLEANPEKKRAIRMIVNDEGRVVAAGEDDGAQAPTFDSRSIKEDIMSDLRRELAPLVEGVGKLRGEFGTLSERAADQAAVDYLKANPGTKDLVSDNTIALARDYRKQHGGDLISAFKNVTYDDAINLSRSKTIETYGIDTETSELPGSRPPVIGGLVLDEKTQDRLFGPDADPDELAKHAKAIREHRKKVSGKSTAIRARR